MNAKPKLKPFLKLFLNTFLILVLLILQTHCSGEPFDNTTQDNAKTILIQNNQFIPNEISISPNQVLFFLNEDSIDHKISAQNSENDFTNNNDFESFFVLAGSVSQVTISLDFTSGDEISFFSETLTNQMVTPNGSITIE